MGVRRAISAVLLAVPLLCSCGGHPRIIPGTVLTDIYAEMLLADQWLADHSEARKASDTTLFYDPIFRRYGYTYEDYDATVRRYLEDPEKFAKVFKNASMKLKDERDRYRRKVEQLDDIREFNASIKGYSAKDFRKDTLMLRSLYKDSLLRADAMARDSLRLDSLKSAGLESEDLKPDSLSSELLRLDTLSAEPLRPGVLKRDAPRPDIRRPEVLKRGTTGPDIRRPDALKQDSSEPGIRRPDALKRDSSGPDMLKVDSLKPEPRRPSEKTTGVKRQILNKDEIHREIRV